jgi:folylpolyglutamate synthase/dihydropteroate synthase
MTLSRTAVTAYTLYLVLTIAIALVSSCLTMNAYAKALRQLYAMNEKNPVRLGLATSQKLYELLGKPLDRMLVVHVGGTNGKGSVSLKTAEALRRGGLNTGLFVSPHISCTCAN